MVLPVPLGPPKRAEMPWPMGVRRREAPVLVYLPAQADLSFEVVEDTRVRRRRRGRPRCRGRAGCLAIARVGDVAGEDST